MMLLEKLWDDGLAGPQPDGGLGKLRKRTPKLSQSLKLENVRTQMQRMDEDNVFKSSTSAIQGLDIYAKGAQTPRRMAAAVAADVADKVAASSSSELIMSSVSSTFAAEEASSAGHTKSSNKSDKTTPVLDPRALIASRAHTARSNQSYQSVIVSQQVSAAQSPYFL